jgi:L-rhamnose-H+ transport protein
MGNPILGVFFHWLGGLASASFYVPYKRIKLWSWEIFWLTGGIFSWVIAPWIGAFIGTKDLFGVLSQTSPHVLMVCIGYGALWGMGGLTFGLTMRYLGLSLGMAVALGLTTVIGTLGPPLVNGTLGDVAAKPGSFYTFLGIAVVLIAIVVVAMAGHRKEKELPGNTEGVSEFNLTKGIAIAVFCGVMSSFFAFGLDYGTPIKLASAAAGTGPLWTGLPVICIVLIGGFLTNLVWAGYLILKNKSASEWVGRPKPGAESQDRIPLLQNYLLAGLGGTLWYFQFFFYTMGESQMGKFGFSSWTLHMGSIILFSTLWGFALKEWKGTSVGTRALVWAGILALVFSTVIIGYGNYIASQSA